MKSGSSTKQLLALFSLAIGVCNTAIAQFNFAPAYTYIYAPELDRVFQLYNTAHTGHANALPPFAHGAGASLGYHLEFSEKGQVWFNPQVGFLRFRSYASNNETTIATGLNLFYAELEVRINPRALFERHGFVGPLGPRWFISFSPGFTMCNAFVEKNEMPVSLDEGEDYRPLATSLRLAAGTGYHSLLVGRFAITPHLKLAWLPAMELEDFAEAVNGHNQLRIENIHRNVLFGTFGLCCSLLKRDRSFWKRQ